MNVVNIIFPHQLFEVSPIPSNNYPVYLVEEYLFFKQYPFHQQKIAFHRASMKAYEAFLQSKGVEVDYVNAIEERSDIRHLIAELANQGVKEIHCIDPTDNWLSQRIIAAAKRGGVKLTLHDSPLFLNSPEDLSSFFRTDKKKFYQTSFYKKERQKFNLLLEEDGQPMGGKWTYDIENRKKYPKNKIPPSIHYPSTDEYYEEARKYVADHFSNHLGELTTYALYPTNFENSRKWLKDFFEQRFLEFGPYEDAIVAEHSILNHSVLTPMLNVGLLTPQLIIDECMKYLSRNDIPINSSEGFIRQIIGWREFIRGVYEVKGSEERTRNFWGFKRKIPKAFYTATTGIPPVDITIKKVLKTGYCHHIERLMVLGNFMLLCEIDPDEVYRWFMELFIDAYDWVMVPNVYGMSQFADGGLMSTKPYISGSNYLKKMSNYPKGEWQDIWDALFWRFMHQHRLFFSSQPRLGMLLKNLDKMSDEKRTGLITKANDFIDQLN